MFSWGDNTRRRRILDKAWPRGWEEILERNSAHALLLNGERRIKWRGIIQVLVAEKNWEGCDGLVMTEELKVTIAGPAALMLLGMQHDYFGKVQSVVVFPSEFELLKEEWQDKAMVAAGMAPHGAVFLAWDLVLAGSRDISSGENLVIHEFAHQLDFLDGYTNGCPELQDETQARRWHEAMSAGFASVQRDLENEGETFMGENAGTNPTEFFAEASERFFTVPRKFREVYPEIYEVFVEYYGLRTVDWFGIKAESRY